ncbi:MAG: hypothetical protein ACXAD7_13515 [Candidatus Kariarchaeaceae archaeon]|jgi:DNA-binding transcriptional regulator GbsR (MarR family)
MNPNRKKYLEIIGQYYKQYGYPELGGWIEGLLTIEPDTKWTQQNIAQRLSKEFALSKKATSVPSVNRALKLLEMFSMIQKEGSRKIGYTYQIAPSQFYISSIFDSFIYANNQFISSLSELSEDIKHSEDGILQTTVKIYKNLLEIMNKGFNKALLSIKKDIASIDKFEENQS